MYTIRHAMRAYTQYFVKIRLELCVLFSHLINYATVVSLVVICGQRFLSCERESTDPEGPPNIQTMPIHLSVELTSC